MDDTVGITTADGVILFFFAQAVVRELCTPAHSPRGGWAHTRPPSCKTV